MTTPATPSQPTPAGDDRNLIAVDATYIAPTLEDKLHGFWKKNGTAVIALCVLVLVGIVAKGGWDYMAAQKEAGVQTDYAAATTPEKLKSFAAAHSGHSLAAVAQLRLADDAYTAGKAADAITGYEQVIATLKTGPLATRAKLGVAMAKISAGQTAEGETALKSLASDVAQAKGVRAEAAYQLASLAAEAGRAEDVKKYSDQVAQIDPASPWTQRAMTLRASLPVAPAAAAVEVKEDAAVPAGVQIKLPGK
ncbi:MAG: tetratricopeptide repeat protein [Undibacterium sp.]|nr:tetratricopeptide repeat protein [Opitutaceae bacterium]